MKVVVLGAGIIGVTSAYELACDGHDVTVIDRAEDVALETSSTNGGQLSMDHGSPLAAPGVIKKAFSWLGKKDAPLIYKLHMDPQLWAWTLRFMSAAKPENFWANAERMLRISLYSRERFAAVRSRETIAFDHSSTGILTVYQNDKDLNAALETSHTLKELGAVHKGFSKQDCINLEPALAHTTLRLAGGIYTPRDESGDCQAFCRDLAKRCQNRGVKFLFNTTVNGFEKDGWKIKRVLTDQGALDGDVFIMALGPESGPLLKELDLHVPIYPTKGYSVTLPVTDDTLAPRTSLTSFDHRLVFSRLGNTLRAAGMMEFSGFDRTLDESRARVVLDNTLKLFPRGTDPAHATFWTGLRPMTPDGPPVLGRAKQENLILNTGHGMLGWSMSMGSARIVADLVKGRAPDIDMTGLGWERYL